MTEEEIQALQETNKQLTQRINQLEEINLDLTSQRKELLAKIKDNTGDEALQKELENYKAQLEAVDNEKAELESKYTQELNSLRMTQQLKEMGIETHNLDALSQVAQLALSEATYKEDGFQFLNEDGTTKFTDENKPYSLADKIAELKNGDKSYLFKETTGGGATDKVVPTEPKTDINSIIDSGLKY